MTPDDRNSSTEGELDRLMRRFYEVISFERGGAPDWEGMRRLFSKDARITRVTPEAIDFMDLNSFQNMAEELLEVGAFTSFHEKEVARRTDRFGEVIHVASAYETRVSKTAVDYLERGVNSLQLVREDGALKIVSLCWDNAAQLGVASLAASESRRVS
jgi:hypothetical protein